jgi:hypothetical protein
MSLETQEQIRPTDTSIGSVLDTMLVASPSTSEKEQLEEQLTLDIEKLDSLRLINPSHYYPFENMAERKKQAIAEVKDEILWLKLELSPFRKINLNFLEWTKPTSPLPAFIVTPMSGEFCLSVVPDKYSEEIGFRFDPVLPKEIESHFNGTIKVLGKHSRNYFQGEEIGIPGRIEGVMPEYARQALQEAEASGMFKNFVLVAEAPAWVINRTNVIKDDPLVIGLTEKFGARLITSFNLTEIEEYLLANN